MPIKIYPQWQQYWQPLDAIPQQFGTEYIIENNTQVLQNKSTVLNEFYLSRTGAQGDNKYASISQWAYDGDSPTNPDQNCTLLNLNVKLAEAVDSFNSGQQVDTLEQDDYQIIFDDESGVLDYEDVNINLRYDTSETGGPGVIFGNLFSIIFGKLFLDDIDLQGIEDDGYGEDTDFGGKFDPQNPYKVNKRLARVFIEGYVRRYRLLRERFPNADLGCYSLNSTWDVLNYDNSGAYECVRRGLSNFLLYINRAGPYGDPNNINFVYADDPGPELGLELLSYMDTASVRLVLGSSIAQIPFPLDNFGDQTQGVNRGVGTLEPFYEDWTIEEATLVMWEQVSTAVGWANTAVNYVNTDPVNGEILSRGTYKLSDYLNVAVHLPYRFANAGYGDEGRNPVPPQLFDLTLELLELANQNRESKLENIFYWAGAFRGTNIFAFTPQGEVFTIPLTQVDDDDFPFDPANPYTPTGKLFDLDLFNVSGCDLPIIPLPPEQIQAITNVINGEAFRSPVESAVNTLLSGVGDLTSAFADAIDVSLVTPDGSPLATFVDANGNLQVHTAASYMSERFARATEISNEFQDHAYRLSGMSSSLEGFGEGGSIGDLPGLSGIQAIATSYNNIRNAIDGGNIGEALVDHYSPFFSSILGPGDALYESFNSLVNGDIRNFISTFPIKDGRLDLSEATQDQLNDLISLGNNILDFEESIRNLIDSDNNLYFAALDYVAKSTLGFSVLTMLEDPCFSQKLLGQIVKPDLKGLLNIP